MAPAVQGLNLTQHYGPQGQQGLVLDGVSLEIYPGEMVAIRARPSPSKSMLLHILGGMQRPDSGRVAIDDLDLGSLNDEDLVKVRCQKVGFVFEAFNLLPNESVLRNVQLPLTNQGNDLAEIHDKAMAALQTVGLDNRLGHRPGQLSARQRQCVAIARALVNDPSVIFADEPTRALDSSSREEIIGLLQKLNDQGRTIVIATDDSGVASHCRRVIRIADSRTAEDSLVSKRRIIPAFRVPGTPPQLEDREEVLVCSRCNHGNEQEQENCARCSFPLNLTPEEARSIEIRISGADNRLVGVESAYDDDDVLGAAIVEELREIPVFAGLGPPSLLRLQSSLELHSYPPGAAIVKQGHDGDSFYVIRKGTVKVVLDGLGGQSIPVATLGAKEGFGEMALLTGQRRSANVVAMTDVQVWRLSRAAFDAILGESVSLSIYFNRILSHRLKDLQERLYDRVDAAVTHGGGRS